MNFEFATAGRIVFGDGTAMQLSQHTAALGSRAFVITGSNPARLCDLLDSIDEVAASRFAVGGEPSTDLLAVAAEQARADSCDMVIGIGGGSVIDMAKAVAALLTNSGAVMDYLEVVGLGKPLTNPSAACIAVPTTAGTGAEVTRNAVLYVPDKQVKVSMRSATMLPRLAIVDPELACSMSPAVTASTGLDALTQLIEPYVSHLANPLTDGICLEGLSCTARSLGKAYENDHDMQARRDMSLASLFGGLALANAKLGAVHGFAGPLGGMIGAPHGVICARLLPHVIGANINALLARDPENPAIARYDRVAQIMTGSNSARAKDAIDWVSRLCLDLQVPSLTEYGLKPELIPLAVEKAKHSSSMKGNPITLTDEELTQILAESL
ncbi:MAG: iron-containing alcohol dehydrogenase [Planctomycetes bacterium]|nr:iron-containing alcohol dehydrogenase [Planctomycetota bacterium]